MALLLMLLCCQVVSARQVGTVVTSSGDTYRDVSFKPLRRFFVLEVESDGQKIFVSYHRVASILNAGGDDITKGVIGIIEEFSPERISALQRSSALRDCPSRRDYWGRWIFTASLAGGIGGGNGPKGYPRPQETYAGLGLDVTIPLGSGAGGVRCGVLATNRSPNHKFKFMSEDPNETILSQDIDARALSVHLAYQHTVHSHFWYVGLGVIRHTLIADLRLRYRDTGGTGPWYREWDQTTAMAVGGAGTYVRLSNSLGVSLGGNLFLIHKTDKNLSWYGDNGVFGGLQLNAGLSYGSSSGVVM